MIFSWITLLAASLVICTGTAIQGSFDDLPTQCTSVCSSLASASKACSSLARSADSQAYVSCMCDGQGASTAIPLCEACVHQVKVSQDPNQGYREYSNNDANRLLKRCGYNTIRSYDLDKPSSTLFVAADTAAAASASVSVPPTTDVSKPASTGVGSAPSTARISVTPATSQSSSTHVPNLAISMTGVGAQGLSFVAGMGLLVAAAIL